MSPAVQARVLQTQSDERLAAAAGEGHESAFEVLVLRYREPLLYYSRRLGLSEARAEDVAQQSLMRAWISLQRGAPVRNVRAWLYRIAHNATVDALRGPAAAHEQLTDEAGEIAGVRGDPEGAVAVREIFADLAMPVEDARQVVGDFRRYTANPPTAEQQTAWQNETADQLRREFGPSGAAQALRDAHTLASRDPRVLAMIESAGLGNHPGTVMRLARIARAERNRGWIK